MKNWLKSGSGTTPEPPQSILSLVMRGLARLTDRCETLDQEVRDRIRALVQGPVDSGEGITKALSRYLANPSEADVPFGQIAQRFDLEPVEIVAIRLSVAAEQDLLIGHVLSHLQQPLALTRPTIGLIAQAYAPDEVNRAVQTLGQGNAVRCGLLQTCSEERPLPERQLRVPLPTTLALQGSANSWPATTRITSTLSKLPLGATAESRIRALATHLSGRADDDGIALVIRCGDSVETRAAAAQIATQMSLQPILVQTDQLLGMAPWLVLNRLLPTFSQWLAPGERRAVPVIPGYHGPLLILTGPDGEFETDEGELLEWRMEAPAVGERITLWQNAINDPALAQRLASEHRLSAGRIAELATKAQQHVTTQRPSVPTKDKSAAAAPKLTYSDIRTVARRGDSLGLGSMAEMLSDEVGDEALVLNPTLRAELESLVCRCRMREQFAKGLGPSIQARYRPSVRALFVGPSGCGKTLAVGWLATRLGIPLFRVDLAAITSKYIGETEKNLSQLLARAEHNEILLLFDEADSLFGKRTDVHDANDRFANSQTNYLLQRMESYDGITILTSNSRSRFDEAFSRRFDAIVSFDPPAAEQRRELWLAHLGAGHDISTAQLNQISAVAELTGGQIRNAVLRSAVAAAQDGTSILHRHLLNGVATEYQKMSRQLPKELKPT